MKTAIRSALLALLLATLPAAAQTIRIWDGGGADNNWGTANNWNNNTLPADGDYLVFEGNTKPSNTNNLLASAAGILFRTSAAFTNFSTGVLALSGGITNQSSDNRLRHDLLLGSPAAFLGLANTLVIESNTVDNGGFPLFMGGSGSVTLSGVLTGSGPLTTSNGTSTLRLDGNNAGYSGVTTVQTGGLFAGHSNALGSAGAGTEVKNGGSLRFQNAPNNASFAEPLTIAGAGNVFFGGPLIGNQGFLGALHTGGNKTIHLLAPVALAESSLVKVDGGSAFRFGGNIAATGDADLTFQLDGGTVSAVTGTVSLGSGRLARTSGAPLTLLNALTAGSVSNAGGTLTLAGGNTIGGLVVNQSGTTVLTGTNGIGGLSVNGGTVVVRGPAGQASGGPTAIGGNGVLALSNSAAANLGDRLGGAVSIHNGTLQFQNDGTDNAFSESLGGLTIGPGYARIVLAPAGAGSGSSTLSFDSLSHLAGGTANFVGAGLGAVNNRLAFSTPPALDDGIVGGWALANTNDFATYDGTAGSVRPLQAAEYYTASEDFWDAFMNLETTAGVTLTGDRRLNTLKAAPAATSVLDLGGRTLRLESGGLLVVGASQYSVSNGVLAAGASNDVPAQLSLHQFSSANVFVDAAIADNGSGPVTLAVDGIANLVLTATNTYSGGTYVGSGATLIVGGAGTGGTGRIVGGVTNHGALVFNRSDAYAYDGDVTGVGTFRIRGVGAAVYSGVATQQQYFYLGQQSYQAPWLYLTNGSIAVTADARISDQCNGGKLLIGGNGTLRANVVTLGFGGTGTNVVEDGAVIAANLRVIVQEAGGGSLFDMRGGTVSAQQLYVGYGSGGAHKFLLKGGLLDLSAGVSGNDRGIVLSRYRLPGETNTAGFFEMTGGTAWADQVRVYGDSPTNSSATSKATFNLFGGTLNLGNGGMANHTTWRGTTSINLGGGTLRAVENLTLGLPMTLTNAGGTVTFHAGDTNGVARNITASGRMSGPGGFVKTGNGNFDIRNINTFEGPVAVYGGAIQFTNDAQLGTAPATLVTNQLVFDGGGFKNNTVDGSTHANRGVYLGPAHGRFTVGWSRSFTINGPVTGPGGIRMSVDSGALVLANPANDYAGDTVMGEVFPLGSYSNAGARACIRLGADHVIPDGPGKGDVVVTNVPYGAFLLNAVLDLNGKNETVNGLVGNGRVANPSATPCTLAVGNNDATGAFSGSITGAVALVKTGAGALTLSGTNTYSGGTVVSNGTLRANGAVGSSTGTGAVTVAPGGRLEGNGRVGGALTVEAGGALAPGDGVGTLTVDGPLALQGGAVLDFTLGTAGDLVAAATNLVLGGTLHVTAGAGFGAGTNTLFTYGGTLSGNLPSFGSMPAGYSYAIDTNTAGRVDLVVGVSSLTPFEQWQTLYFGGTNAPNGGAADDWDGDGSNNGTEFEANTNPTNAASAFRAVSLTLQGNDVRLGWQAGGGRTNQVQVETGVFTGTNFVDLGGPVVLPGAGDVTTNYLDAGAATNTSPRSYRVRLSP